MTPEQKKAKEIVEKYRKITYIDEYGNENYERLSLGAAKSFAIEEVKAVIKAFDEANAYDLLPSIEYYEKVLTEIEKLWISKPITIYHPKMCE